MVYERREKKVEAFLRDSRVVREARLQPRKSGSDRGRLRMSTVFTTGALTLKAATLLHHVCSYILNEEAIQDSALQHQSIL